MVWEREGRVWSFENREAEYSEKKLVLDISNQCQGWDDSGLLGLAFHPNFAKNHYVYIWYRLGAAGDGGRVIRTIGLRTDKPNRDRLSRFTLDENGVAIPNSELVLIDQEDACRLAQGRRNVLPTAQRLSLFHRRR